MFLCLTSINITTTDLNDISHYLYFLLQYLLSKNFSDFYSLHGSYKFCTDVIKPYGNMNNKKDKMIYQNQLYMNIRKMSLWFHKSARNQKFVSWKKGSSIISNFVKLKYIHSLVLWLKHLFSNCTEFINMYQIFTLQS